jgi:hypothetical protein
MTHAVLPAGSIGPFLATASMTPERLRQIQQFL